MMRFIESQELKLEVFPKSMDVSFPNIPVEQSTIFSPNPLHPVNHQILLASLLWSLWVASSLVNFWDAMTPKSCLVEVERFWPVLAFNLLMWGNSKNT